MGDLDHMLQPTIVPGPRTRLSHLPQLPELDLLKVPSAKCKFCHKIAHEVASAEHKFTEIEKRIRELEHTNAITHAELVTILTEVRKLRARFDDLDSTRASALASNIE